MDAKSFNFVVVMCLWVCLCMCFRVCVRKCLCFCVFEGMWDESVWLCVCVYSEGINKVSGCGAYLLFMFMWENVCVCVCVRLDMSEKHVFCLLHGVCMCACLCVCLCVWMCLCMHVKHLIVCVFLFFIIDIWGKQKK